MKIRTIQTYSKGAPFYNALIRTLSDYFLIADYSPTGRAKSKLKAVLSLSTPGSGIRGKLLILAGVDLPLGCAYDSAQTAGGRSFSPMADQVVGQDALVGQRLGHYRIIEQIGSGGMGVVYRAHDEHLDREIAIKVLRPGTLADQSRRKHFRKEALALSKLNHPNIATIHDFDTQQDVDFLVMEYIPGITLNAKLAEASLAGVWEVAKAGAGALTLLAALERRDNWSVRPA